MDLIFNEYQSSLEELKIDSYPQEVQNEFFEAINGIPFVKNLINVARPRCKDLPRDKEGKAIIDITNPPILEDVDYFRPTALHYKKYGVITNLRPNPNPNSESGKWIREEIRRIWNGYIRESDGAWISGDMYWYLNYCPIIQSKIRKGTKIADRIVDFPEFWEGIWLRFLYIEESRLNAEHSAEIAKLLSKLGSVMLLDCMTEKYIEEYVYKKYKVMVEEELANRGIFEKIKDAVTKVFK